MDKTIQNITFQIPATPEVVQALTKIFNCGVSLTLAQNIEFAEEMISLRQAADECEYSYDIIRKWVVNDNRIPFNRPSGSPRGKILIRRGDLQSMIRNPEHENSKPTPGRPRLSTRVPIL